MARQKARNALKNGALQTAEGKRTTVRTPRNVRTLPSKPTSAPPAVALLHFLRNAKTVTPATLLLNNRQNTQADAPRTSKAGGREPNVSS